MLKTKQVNIIQKSIINLIFLIIFFLIFISCENQKKTFYEDGNIKSLENYNSDNKKDGQSIEYYRNGVIKEKKIFRNGFLIDSVSRYHENGLLDMSIHLTQDSTVNLVSVFDSLIKLKSEGYVKNGEKIGFWKYYENNKLIGEDHFFNIENKTIKLNQQKVMRNDIVDDERSFYYKIDTNDTINFDDQIIFKMSYNFRPNDLVYGENKFIYLLISQEINKYFSNIKEVKIDTFIPIQKGIIRGNLKANKIGTNYLRGIIEEHNLIEDGDSLRIEIIKMYFEKKIYVEDTITKRGTYKIEEQI